MNKKIEAIKPYSYKKGQSGNPFGKPKGVRNFKTDFKLACKAVAEALRLGEKPDAVLIELVKRGIKEGLAGNYPFWRDLMDRSYGKIDWSGLNVQSDKTIIFNIVKDDGKDDKNSSNPV